MKRRLALLFVADALLLLGLACWAPHLVDKPSSVLPPTLVVATPTPFPGRVELLSVEMRQGPIEAQQGDVEGLTETLSSDWTPIATTAQKCYALARLRIVNHGRLPLDLGAVQAMLVDGAGRRYRRDGEAELLLAQRGEIEWELYSVPAGSTRETVWVFEIGDEPVPPYHVELLWSGYWVRSEEVEP